MKKTNNISTLLVACVFSLGINNTLYTAATRTPHEIADDFIIAIRNNDDKKIIALTQEGVDYQCVYNRPIMTADVDLVRALIDNGVKYNDTFINAAQNGDLNTVRILLEAGADGNITHNGTTPLYAAAQNGHEAVVRYLINQDNTDVILARYKKNNVLVAAGCAIFRSKITTGKVNVNKACERERTPLLTAVAYGHLAVARCLIAEGKADVNQPNKFGMTPMIMAAEIGHHELVNLLIASSANVNKTQKKALSPALVCAASHGHIGIIDSLVIQGDANINKPDGNGATPLHAAIQEGHIQAAYRLITLGANVNASDKMGITPLHIATNNGNTLTVDFLLNNGAIIPPNIFFSVSKNNIALPIIKCLLIKQLQATQQKMNGVGKYNETVYGCVGANCQALSQVSGDLLNRILWYVDAQDYAPLRLTCRGMSRLQADSIGQNALLRQQTCRDFLNHCAQYEAHIKPGEVKLLWENFKQFLQEEEQAPICNIEEWKTSARCAIDELAREEKALPPEMEQNENSPEEIKICAPETLIQIVEDYFQTAREMMRAPTHYPE